MYTDILLGFKENIESLEKFVEQVEPTLASDLSEEKVEDMEKKVEVVRAILKSIKKEHESKQATTAEENEQATTTEENEQATTTEENEKKVILDSGEEIKICTSEIGEYIGDVIKFKEILKSRNSNYSILYKSVLMSLIIYLESTVSDVIKQTCMDYPERLGDKTLTLKEVKESGSIDEAISKIVEKEIESLMFKGFDEWIKFLKNNLKLNMEYLNSYQSELTEIIARRNIMVHNRGIVNHTYLSKVSNEYLKDVQLGDVLNVNRRYIDRSMKVISVIGYLILIDVILKVNRGNNEVIDDISSLAFDVLYDEKWEVALEIYLLLYKVKGINAKERLTFQINYWQCFKWLDRYDEIKKEVDEIDLSAHTSIFRLCVYALKDEYEKFFGLLNKDFNNLKEAEELDEVALDTWPIFKNIRERTEYNDFKLFIKGEPILRDSTTLEKIPS